MSALFADTVTVYNRRPARPRPPFPPEGETWERTVIRGAMWSEKTQAAETQEGASVAERTVTVTVPAKADAEGRTYLPPGRFAVLPSDDRGHWTARLDGTNPDIVVLGEGPEIGCGYTADDLMRDFPHMRPQAVSDSLGQAVLPMLRITGA